MRRHYSQVDNLTRWEIILSECGYNEAMMWLENTLSKHKVAISGTATHQRKINDTWHKFTAIVTEFQKNGKFVRTFYWDENRGYLLGE